MPEALRAALLGPGAQDARRRVSQAALEATVSLRRFFAVANRIERERGVTGFDVSSPAALSAQLGDLLRREDELRAFLGLRDRRRELDAIGVGPLLARAEALGVRPKALTHVFDGVVARRRAEAARRRKPILAKMTGNLIQAHREEFVERDRQKIETDRTRVRQALVGVQPPRGSKVGPRKTWTEMELLHAEFGKQQRFTNVRALASRAGGAMRAMKPCFMMSPLSLAKFMPARSMRFDLLVIDEASQMRPEDALGGLLRADQLVVVGDQQQLPPTDFFSRAGAETPATDDDEDAFEDLEDESILEACQKAFRQTRMLRWHYRSRCESLIAFSNKEFYRGELITFPMARPGSFSVDLVRVQGYYVARRNTAEAQVVAEEAIEFMRRHAGDDADKIPSLGIVAVNSDQRDLVFEEVRRLQGDDPLVESYREKVAAKGEPFFVKNLENVQGDERDYIFVSLTYGPKPGQTAMRERSR